MNNMKNMNNKAEMVWPVEGYTDKINFGIRMAFQSFPWLSFTKGQIKTQLTKGYVWLKVTNDRQSVVLDKLISTGVKKLIQSGKVKKVTSNISVEPQWQAASTVAESGYINVTSEDSVAKTSEALKAISRRSIGSTALYRLNNLNPA